MGKNLIFAFTIICAFVFVVFSIQLLALNSGRDADTSPPPASSKPSGGKTSPGQASPSGSGQAGGANQSGGQGGDASGDPGDAPAGPVGTPYEIPLSNRLALTLYVNEDPEVPTFEYIESEADGGICTLKYLGDGAAALEFRYVQLPHGALARAQDYLEEFFEVEGSSVRGEEPIKNSPLEGVAVKGELGSLTYEAWIHSFADIGANDTGLAVIISYQNPLQMNVLYAVLDTMALAGITN